MNTPLDFFFQGYLVSLIFWLGLPLGALLILMMHTLTGGKWGEKIAPSLEEISGLLCTLALLFLPFCFLGLPHVYDWARNPGTPMSHAKHIYFTPVFFTLRSLGYFFSWFMVKYFFLSSRSQRAAAVGLIVLFFTISFAAIDWVMSLEAKWYSTVFGLLIVVGMGTAALSFSILKAARRESTAKHFDGKDLGNLLLAGVMVWAYLSFSQYLIMWMGNMPEETNWFMTRTHGGWGGLAALLILFQFFVPFFILLFRAAKNSIVLLGGIAALVLIMHLVEIFWTVIPADRGSAHLSILDVAAFALTGAVCLFSQRSGWRLTRG